MLKPKHLSRGDTVAVVSLSSGSLGEPNLIHKYYLAKERLERDYGLQLRAMPNALRGRDYVYRHPEARAQDLMDAFRDPSIRAVICAIGGDDTVRLLPYIDFSVLHDNPKIFTGFSDTTTNHFMMHKAGLVSYYGLSLMCDVAEYVSINEYTREMMENTIFDPQPRLDIPCSSFCAFEKEKVKWAEENMNIPRPRRKNTGYEILQGSGKVEGELLGGCVDVFVELFGTELWPKPEDWSGKLLLLETSEEDMPDEQLCWYLRGMQAQGILSRIRGIVFGKPAAESKFESYKEILRQVVGFEAGLPELPILYNVNVGHSYPIGLFPLGLRYELDCDNRRLTLLEPATI
ncbi:MAG: LD-carboxypeptidase [Oscillospiraceae bacterium]|nr:LD-carboxypeptidase [Oscillospiraceae bacterium]